MKHRKPYTKSPKWLAAQYQQRIGTAERNISIYKALQPPVEPGTIERLKKEHNVSDKRLYQLRDKVQKMIDNNEVELELFGD